MYIPYQAIANELGIEEGDVILIHSDITQLMWSCKKNGEIFNGNYFIDSILNKIGSEGTLLIPTFNHEFCEGKEFDYYKTRSQAGILGDIALGRKDFVRTRHAMVSFAVSGKGKKELFEMKNKTAFGKDSPLGFLYRNCAKEILIGIDYNRTFTFVHHAEENVGNLEYRFQKDFSGYYTDWNGERSYRTYTMQVRYLTKAVTCNMNAIGEELEKAGVSRHIKINGIDYRKIDLYQSYPIIEKDIKENKSRKLFLYEGQ